MVTIKETSSVYQLRALADSRFPPISAIEQQSRRVQQPGYAYDSYWYDAGAAAFAS